MSLYNAQRTVAYDNPTAVTRVAAQLAVNAAGSGAVSGKFYAWAALTVYGVTFFTIAAGTSTYTVAGTATNPATQFSAIYITNTNTTGTALSLATSTIGPFTIGGTATAGTNVGGVPGVGGGPFVSAQGFLGGVGGIGGIVGGFQGPYALNTVGGTNTTQVFGTFTASLGYPGNAGAGVGGLPMNIGDVLYFVGGTDATATVIPTLQYSVQYSGGTAPILGVGGIIS